MLKNMLNLIKHETKQTVRLNLTHDKFNYAIYFADNALETIKLAKGLESDAKLAGMLGITRAYLSMLRSRKAPVTAEVIVRVAVILNNTATNWHKFFVITIADEKVSYQKYNMAKYAREMPYASGSVAAEHRKLDNKEIEKKPLTDME